MVGARAASPSSPRTRDTNSELDLTLQFPADQQGWHNYYAGCATHRHRDTHSGVIQLEPSAGEDFFGGQLMQKFSMMPVSWNKNNVYIGVKMDMLPRSGVTK